MKQTITKDRLAQEIDALLAPCPDPMSRNDFRIACHIGTRTASAASFAVQLAIKKQAHHGSRFPKPQFVSTL